MLIHTEDSDEPLEVDPDQVEVEDEDPYLSQDEVNNVVSKRLSRQERQLKEDLKEDDEFFQEAAQERGVELREDGRPKGSIADDELKELKQKASKVESLEEKVSEYEEQIQSTRETKLENQLLQAADGFASDQAKQTFLREAKARMTYDDEFGWAATDEEGDGLKYQAGEPVGPSGVIEDLKETHDFLFRDKSASSGPSDEPTSSGSGGKRTWTESEHAAADPAQMSEEEFQSWKTAAEEGRIRS